jgi:cytochrome P450
MHEVSVFYDPYSRAVFDDPYPVYRSLRDDAPLYRDPQDRWWVLSRFEDVWSAVRDHVTFSSRLGPDPANPDDNGRKYSIISMDPPRHDRVRSILNRAFTPDRIAGMERQLREIVEGHFDELEVGTRVDAIRAFAGPIPSDVIGALLAVPAADRPYLREQWDLFLAREEGVFGLPRAAIDASRRIGEYVSGLVDERRAHPGSDLISMVLHAEYRDEHGDVTRLDDHDVLMFCNLLSAAGSETTQKLIGNALVALAEHHDEWRRIVDDPSRIAGAVDEALRYDTPSHYIARTATRDVALHDGVISAGDWVLLLLGAANRDDREYPEPDLFRADRRPDRTVYFGWGRHVCLGQWLARREAAIVLELMAARFPNYEVGERTRILTSTVRGFDRLELELR